MNRQRLAKGIAGTTVYLIGAFYSSSVINKKIKNKFHAKIIGQIVSSFWSIFYIVYCHYILDEK